MSPPGRSSHSVHGVHQYALRATLARPRDPPGKVWSAPQGQAPSRFVVRKCVGWATGNLNRFGFQKVGEGRKEKGEYRLLVK